MDPIQKLYRTLSLVIDQSPKPPTETDFTEYKAQIDAVLAQVQHLTNGSYFVPSPWHAAILCAHLMAKSASGVILDQTVQELDGDAVPARHLVFRGEGNSTRKLLPYLWRPSTDSDLARKALSCFCPVLKRAIDKCFEDRNLDVQLGLATAQHFGIPTSFLDWSTDPFVAVRFASQSPDTVANAVVYVLPLDVANNVGGRFYMPAPFLKRLYVQRGFFIEPASLEQDQKLAAACMRIEFPHHKEFQVIRGGNDIELLSPADFPWLDKVREWAWERAKEGEVYDQISSGNAQDLLQRIDNVLESLGTPEELAPANASALFNQWVFSSQDLIARLTQFKSAQAKLHVNTTLLKAIVRDNPILLNAIASALTDQASREGSGSDEYADLIFSILKDLKNAD